MRLLPALLLVAAPLLAQEPPDEQRAKTERARLTDEYRRLVEELRSKSEATRTEALEALKRANASLDDLLPLVAEALRGVEEARLGAVRLARSTGTRALLLGSETISGSADGTEYTLKSLGGGRYDLTATKRDGDGKVMEETKDEGTLKELQQKHAFLRSDLLILEPLASDARGRIVGPSGEAVNRAVLVTTPWVGGGQVGVTVVAPSDDLRFHLELPEGAGFLVQEVAPGSRAEQIGIRRMDVLLRLDGELIDSPVQLKKLHEKAGVLELIRRSETRKIELGAVAADADGR